MLRSIRPTRAGEPRIDVSVGASATRSSGHTRVYLSPTIRSRADRDESQPRPSAWRRVDRDQAFPVSGRSRKGPFGETKRRVLGHGGPGPLQREVRRQ